MQSAGMAVSDSAGTVHNATVVDSVADRRLSAFVGSKDRVLRLDRSGLFGRRPVADGHFLAESDIVIQRAVRSGLALVAVVIHVDRTRPLPFELPDDVPLFALDRSVALDLSASGDVDGSLALFERPALAQLGEYLGGAERGPDRSTQRWLMLVGVTNPINVGVIARTAAALGVDAVVIDGSSVDPFYRRASRVSMGEAFAVRWIRAGDPVAAIDRLQSSGFACAALTPAAGAQDIASHPWGADRAVVLVMGSEGPGLAQPVLDACELRVRIPISESVDSLNVAAATAIAVWELTNGRCAGE